MHSPTLKSCEVYKISIKYIDYTIIIIMFFQYSINGIHILVKYIIFWLKFIL
jgi:hypothetical protein